MNALTPITDTNRMGQKVLIVDDATTIRRYHRMIVEEAGFSAEEAFNGVEALEKASKETFCLYLVDVNMPEMNGYEFLSELRRLPEHHNSPVIMISTEAEALDAEKAMVRGANFYLVKPATPASLSACLHLLSSGTTA